MQPLTREETIKANEYLASLGPDQAIEKNGLLSSFRQGGEQWLDLIRSKINPQ